MQLLIKLGVIFIAVILINYWSIICKEYNTIYYLL